MLKKLILAIAILSFSSSLFAQKEEVRNLKPFESIHAYKGINVVLEEGDTARVRVMIENGELSDVLTDVEGHTLKIRMQTKIYKDVAVTAVVTYKKLVEIVASTGAEVTGDETLTGDKIKLKCNTGSSIRLNVETNSIDLDASEGSNMTISGSTQILNTRASAGSNIEAGDLVSEDAYAKSSSGASILIHVNNTLEANATLGGSVVFSGKPENTDFKTSLGGNVSPQ